MDVRQGIIPLSFATRPDFQDKARFQLLLDTIGHHWKGTEHFSLYVIVPAEELSYIAASTIPRDNLRLEFVPEEEVIGNRKPIFSRLDWWRRQQLLKLLYSSALKKSGVLIFNSDVICVQDFNQNTFISDGKLVSDWEPKSGQRWWSNVSALLGQANSQHSYGLSVVPNTVSCELASRSLDYFESTFGDLLTFVGLATKIAPVGEINWTDFSMYTMIAEMTGDLERFHVSPSETFSFGKRVRANQSVWSVADYAEKLRQTRNDGADGIFLAVQSALLIPPEQIRRDFAGNIKVGKLK